LETIGFGIAVADTAAQLGQAFGLEGLHQPFFFGFDGGQCLEGLMLQLHVALFHRA
jgi:hypothetical protein